MPKTVVAIHGVGPGAPSETGRAVAQNLGFRVVRQITVYADGEALLEMTDGDTKDSALEVLRSINETGGADLAKCGAVAKRLSHALQELDGAAPVHEVTEHVF